VVKSIIVSLLLCSLASLVSAQESLRDPTRPLNLVAHEAKGEAALRLQSILYSDARKLAYINGQAVMEQETLPGTDIKVIRIYPDAVSVQQGTKTWRLTLSTLDVRQSSRNTQP
jgi:hypothetical protein